MGGGQAKYKALNSKQTRVPGDKGREWERRSGWRALGRAALRSDSEDSYAD